MYLRVRRLGHLPRTRHNSAYRILHIDLRPATAKQEYTIYYIIIYIFILRVYNILLVYCIYISIYICIIDIITL